MPVNGQSRRRRPRSGRQEEIARVGGKARANGAGQRQGLGRQGIPGLGAQLTRRVQSGAITREQAQQTAKQRQTFKAAYGADWRTKVFGDRGYAQRTRTALAQNPASPQVAALNKQLMDRRQQMLEAARKRLPGGAGQAAPRRRRRRRPAAPQGGGY